MVTVGSTSTLVPYRCRRRSPPSLSNGRLSGVLQGPRADRSAPLGQPWPTSEAARRPDSFAGHRGAAAMVTARSPYLISVSSLNIGRYIEITIVPTITPTPIIRIGSMIDVSDWMLASTSSS